MTWARRRAVAACVVIAGTLLTACSVDADPTRAWDEPADYTATIKYQAYDADAGTYRVIVRDHEVMSFVRIDHRGPAPVTGHKPRGKHFTLRQIVGRYQTALADRESHEEIEFDESGMPAYVSIDWQPLRITDEQAWFITDVRIDNP